MLNSIYKIMNDWIAIRVYFDTVPMQCTLPKLTPHWENLALTRYPLMCIHPQALFEPTT